MRPALLTILMSSTVCFGPASAQIPHHQDRAPGPALSPEEALAKMRVPDGFAVKLFAAEPDVVNPIAMTFDERGRVWITESLEYPRSDPGAGRDRIKILEDSDGDGKADKITIFAEGMNIPSGIAVGYGGVFVANSPDLLFLRDTDGDDRADTKETLVTGFGRTDTHELPNSLMWGPDGWLYGLNGVFNYSKITHQDRTHEFTCALWRYHPKTRAFELFAEGTSNPWGLDYDRNGSFFVSACVIDHLWHLTETGYYHRQGGPYPPFTWKIGSIVEHKHQKAAYCGFCIYDADVYPEEYRGKFFMGNIHGGCINSDAPQRRGAGYFATTRPDLLTADDAWFMPVVQKVGPDGCLWIVDWYDRYHCYQDARRDPKGIDRLKGRIYRLTYDETPMAQPFDLANDSDAELVALLDHANVFRRRVARRLLIERGAAKESLEAIVLDSRRSSVERMETLWTLASSGGFGIAFHLKVLDDPDPTIRAWGVRTAGAMRNVDGVVRERALALVDDPSPDVRLQVAIAARKLLGDSATKTLLGVLASAHEDDSGLTPHIVWRNLEPLVVSHADELVAWLDAHRLERRPAVEEMMPRLIERTLAESKRNDAPLFALIETATDPSRADARMVGLSLQKLLQAAIDGEWVGSSLERFDDRFRERIVDMANGRPGDARTVPALGFALLFGHDARQRQAIEWASSRSLASDARVLLLSALATSDPTAAVNLVARLMKAEEPESDEFLIAILAVLSATDSPLVATRVLEQFDDLSPLVKPQALDLLTSRTGWTLALLDAIDAKRLDPTLVNVNQMRKMAANKDPVVAERVRKRFGQVRLRRDRNRERVISRMRGVLRAKEGDPVAGKHAFAKVCAQCHKLNGEGAEVGPDISRNGRDGLEQILSNLLDPNLVIGAAYQARVVATDDGQIESGLLVEDSRDRVVLKVAGGKSKVFPRERIDAMRVSEVSLMPEDLEKQLKEEEFRDLIAYLLQIEAPADAP